MKLSFLGQSYEASNPAIEATEMTETLTFRGQAYAQRQYSVDQRQPPSAEMTYRGVRYTA